MKKNIFEEAQRMIEIMGKVQTESLLVELNVRYLDQLLDKVSDTGVESLSDYEKDALNKLSLGQDVNPPEVHSLDMTSETLRFTPMDPKTRKPLAIPNDAGDITGEALGSQAKLGGEAAEIAGSTYPMFIDGDLSQLDKPVPEQQIRMHLPHGEYECIAIPEEESDLETWGYEIILKPEEDDEDFLGEMEDYNVTEKWDKDVEIEKTGEHTDKTVADLKKQLGNLKGKKPYDKEKAGELMFAIRAKQGWKSKIKEEEINEDFTKYDVSGIIEEQEDRRAFFGDIQNAPEGDVRKVGDWFRVKKQGEEKIYYVLTQKGTYGDMGVAVLDENYNQIPMDSVPEILNMIERFQDQLNEQSA